MTRRLWQGVFIAVELEFDIAYRIVAWLAWVPNLAAVELYLARQGQAPPAREVRV